MTGKRDKNNNKRSGGINRKLTILFAAVVIVFLCLILYITYINARKGARYQEKALAQMSYDSKAIPYRRGDITDRNGTVLATSERVYKLIMDETVLLADVNEKKKEPMISAVCNIFEIPEEDLRGLLDDDSKRPYIILKKDIDYDTADLWNKTVEEDENLNCNGFYLEEDFARAYPYGTLASDLIGFINPGNSGAWGLEQYYNDELNGTNGREYGYLDNDIGLEVTVKPATDGYSLETTIDTNLQTIVENHMQSWINEYNYSYDENRLGCENMGIIVMDPDTGEVLAMASYPNYDPNSPRDLSPYYTEEQLAAMSDEEQVEALQKIWRNYCVNDTYEPGSTAKVFTVAAGLETGVLNGSETYYCDGYKEVSDHTIKCHLTSGHGELNLEGAIAQSCNVALMDIALDMGQEKFYRYQKIFGFGENTYIDLPGEADTSGLVFNGEDIVDSDLATNSFGQNFNCTMIQMASAYCALINGGHYYKPYVVREILDSNGDIIRAVSPTVVKETVTPETSAVLRGYMYETVNNGTGRNAAVGGYHIAGKTGTAERLPRGNEEYVISFAGFAPYEDPEVLLYIVIDRPNAMSQEDTSLVTTLARQIFEEILPYLNIERHSDEIAPSEPAVTEEYTEDYSQDYTEDYSQDYTDEY